MENAVSCCLYIKINATNNAIGQRYAPHSMTAKAIYGLTLNKLANTRPLDIFN